MIKFIHFIIIILLFTSCITVPRNQNGNGAILIKTKFINEAGNDYKPFGYIVLTTTKEDKTYEIYISPTDGYCHSVNLPAGFYSNWEYYFKYESMRENPKPVKIKSDIIITPHSLTIFPISFTQSLYFNDRLRGHNYIWMNDQYNYLNEDDLPEIIRDFKKDKDFYTWKKLIFGTKTILNDINNMEE